MKKSRFVLCLTLVMILLLSLSPLALAETTVLDKDASASGTEDGSVFLAGANTHSTAEVNGILFSAGNSVSAGGFFQYALLAGNNVSVAGVCENDTLVAGRSVTVSGQTSRDLYAAGQNVSIGGPVGRDLFAIGSTVVLSGSVGGDVYLNADSIVINDGAVIEGTLRYNSNAKISAPQGILARAETYVQEAEVEVEVPKGPTVGQRIKDAIFGYIGLLLVGFGLLWLTPLWEKIDERYYGLPFGKYAAAFGIGFAILIGLPLVSILLMITGFGLRPAFVLLLVYITVLVAAPLVLSFFLGGLIWRRALKQPDNYWCELPIGLLAWRLLSLIPVVKVVVGFVAAPLALGVLTLLLRWKKSGPKNEAEEVPVFPAEPVPDTEPDEPFVPDIEIEVVPIEEEPVEEIIIEEAAVAEVPDEEAPVEESEE